MKKIFLFLCFHCFRLMAWELSGDFLDQPLPEWMLSRLEKDLAPFSHPQKPLSDQVIRQAFSRLHEVDLSQTLKVAYIQFENGMGVWESPSVCDDDPLAEKVRNFIETVQYLHTLRPLPNFSLLLSLDKCFERPLLLQALDVPLFALTKTAYNSKVLLLPRGVFQKNWETFFKDVESFTQPWETKKQIACWRGRPTDWNYLHFHWLGNLRTRLIILASEHPEIDAGFSPPLICETCPLSIAHQIEYRGYAKPFIPLKDFLSYQYLITIDGKGTSSSFAWQLFSGSVVLKCRSEFIEWFTDGLTPGTHYLLFEENLSDLIDKISWLQTHQEEARAISARAYQFAKENLTDDRLFLYLYHLLTRYAECFTVF